jgi:hypothetical protein
MATNFSVSGQRTFPIPHLSWTFRPDQDRGCLLNVCLLAIKPPDVAASRTTCDVWTGPDRTALSDHMQFNYFGWNYLFLILPVRFPALKMEAGRC